MGVSYKCQIDIFENKTEYKKLPALTPALSYQNFNIQEGGTASNTFSAMVQGNLTGAVEQTRKDLLAYCELDTLAMVRILESLKQVIHISNSTCTCCRCILWRDLFFGSLSVSYTTNNTCFTNQSIGAHKSHAIRM